MTDTTLGREQAGARSVPAEIQARVMTDELERGRAQHLSATIKDFVRYLGVWWIMDRDVWFAVDDEELAASLEAAARAMADADATVRPARNPTD